MSFKNIATAAVALAVTAVIAPAQTSKTFDFSSKPTSQSLQEAATILRTVGDIGKLTIDSAAVTITIQGTPDELAMSGWILHSLDQPPAPSPSPSVYSESYLVAGKSDDIIRIFHLGNVPKAPQAIQEVLTTLRTVADVQKVFNYTSLNDVVLRGPASQVALAEYLIKSFDVAPGSVTTAPEYASTTTDRSGAPLNQVVQVFYLANMKTPQQIQELLTIIRTINDITKIFDYMPLNAVAIRASAADLAAAAWEIRQLDIPASAKPDASAGPREYTMTVSSPPATNIVRVFFPPHITTPQAMQETLTALRAKLSLHKLFNYTALNALVVRGSADQITKAEQLIAAQDQLAKATP